MAEEKTPLKWKFETGYPVRSSPSVAGGVVYFGSNDKHFYANSSELKWKFETGDSIHTSPAVADGIVYFGSYDNHLYALEAKTGELKWKFETGGSVLSSPSVADDIVYFGSYDNYLYALEAKTGELKWNFETGGSVLSSPAVADGVVYFGSYDNHLYALDAKTGEVQWNFETEYRISSSPAVVDGIIYFGTDDKYFYALDVKIGKEKWKFKTGGSRSSSPAVAEGVVYFGSYDNHLYALDAKTGKEKWKFKTGDIIHTSPAVVDGVVYFGSDDNHLYAIDIKKDEELHQIEKEQLKNEKKKRQEEERLKEELIEKLTKLTSFENSEINRIDKERLIGNAITALGSSSAISDAWDDLYPAEDKFGQDCRNYLDPGDLPDGITTKIVIEEWINNAFINLKHFYGSNWEVQVEKEDEYGDIYNENVPFYEAYDLKMPELKLSDLDAKWTDDIYNVNDHMFEIIEDNTGKLLILYHCIDSKGGDWYSESDTEWNDFWEKIEENIEYYLIKFGKRSLVIIGKHPTRTDAESYIQTKLEEYREIIDHPV